MSYNGHKNWNHWNVSLWINNDERLYNMARGAAKQAKKLGFTLDDAANDLLLDLPEKTPDGAPYTFSSVRAAIRGILD